MNFLEICGLIFIAVIILNGIVGIVALRSARESKEEVKISYNS